MAEAIMQRARRVFMEVANLPPEAQVAENAPLAHSPIEAAN